MHLHLRADAVNLSEQYARKLDDEFFLSRPAAYFSSRISSILAAEHSAATPTAQEYPEFFSSLNLTGGDELLEFSAQDRRTQVAVEALSLRHQAAEALMRFLYSVTVAEPRTGDARCAWLAVADSPTRLVDVVEKTVAALNADDELFLRALLVPGTVVDERVAAAADTAVAWMNHASALLTDNELSVNAAHNKVKHGLAVSARGDVRIELLTTPPKDLREIPLSAFGEGNSVPIFDRPMLTYLSRPHGTPKQGLEAISLRVEVPVVLAETWMIANVYSAMFHVAARRHFGEQLPDGVASYPTLVIGRLPEHVIGGRPLGYRSPVTLPPDGVTAPRRAGLFFHGRFVSMDVDYENKVQGVVVDG